VGFRRDGAAAGEPLTVYLFAGRAVFFTAKSDETENAVWETWIVPTLPILAPEGMGAPPLLALPAGRPFVVELGVNLVSKPVVLRAPPVPGFPVDPETEAWKLEIVVELDRLGPPVFVAVGRAGSASPTCARHQRSRHSRSGRRRGRCRRSRRPSPSGRGP
jgi:hypothetical protein